MSSSTPQERVDRTELIELVNFLGKNNDFHDALNWAAREGYFTIFRLLLACVRNPAEVLQHACENNCAKVIQMLLNNGVDIHTDDDCALCYSSSNGDAETVRMLLERGASVHARDDRALKRAASYGRYANVKVLLEYGAGADAGNRERTITTVSNCEYVVGLATSNGYPKVAQLLWEYIETHRTLASAPPQGNSAAQN